MKILKILNNNVVISKNDKEKEIIVSGRGLAFKKKVGDIIEKDKIDKIYTLSTEMSLKFQELLLEIPIEHIELGYELINNFKTKLVKKINDNIYISLIDHISTAINRYKEGIKVKNMLLWDIKKFYKEEYELGLEALDIIEMRTGVRLEEDEAGFLALHLVNSEIDENFADIYEITKIMQEIVKIIKYHFNVSFDENSFYYYRFITHLKFLAYRLTTKKMHNDEFDSLLDVVKLKYENSYLCALKINEFIKSSYNFNLSNEEILYLTIHISRVVYKSN